MAKNRGSRCTIAVCALVLLSCPSAFGRINMGAYGGTAEASKSLLGDYKIDLDISDLRGLKGGGSSAIMDRSEEK